MSVSSGSSCTSFACDVTQQLQYNARELSKETGIKAFCSALAAELANVQEFLESSTQEPEEPRLLKLLNNLEKLCQWPTRSSSSSTSLPFNRKQYPALARLLTKRQLVKKAIKDFACDTRGKKDRESFLRLLKGFTRQKKDIIGPELSELELADTTLQDDYQAHIRALYHSLSCYCSCSKDDGQKEITANLRLNGCCSPGDIDDSVQFRLFFLDHPHYREVDGACQWQDTQVCVLRKRGIKLKGEKSILNNLHAGELISLGTFCEIITNRKRSQLKLVVSDDGLVFNGPGRLSEGFLLGSSSVSLARLLDGAKLHRRMRLLLSYFLAKAVWQFYDSEWMQTEWTKETVHFMFERRSKTPKGIFVNEPFLSASFNIHGKTSDTDNRFRVHIFPKVLALGIMLLEIELGIKIEDYRAAEDQGSNGAPDVNADHIAAIEVFENRELWEKRDTFDAFKDVIGVCLTPDQFKPFLGDVQGIRDAFAKHVVNPLQALYKTAWGDPDTANVPAVELDASKEPPSVIDAGAGHPGTHTSIRTQSPDRLPAPTAIHPYQISHHMSLNSLIPHTQMSPIYNYTQFSPLPSFSPFQDGVMAASPSSSSDGWFEEQDKLNLVLRPKPNEKDSTYQPVKIAILDTGVSEHHADSIKAYKDFANGDDDEWQDATGHGTSAVQLIQKIYNIAELYVGRVFERPQATDTTASLMAKAVRHAQEVWKVDIIVMPSGFRSDNDDLEKAIDGARNSRVLIFAAASNYGNITHVAFPGRLYIDLKLFCMFSTDPNGRALPNFNPTPRSEARYSFAILGENISLPGKEKPLSGTSFATMIGGAIAGRILDFSRHKDNRERIRKVEKLHTVEGMSAVFHEMARGALDNGYHCMSPWKILPDEIKDEEPKAKRTRERNHICETISRALEMMHR